MSLSVNGQSRVLPGFRFHPMEEEILCYYLKKKVSFEQIDLDVIRDVDLNKLEPWDIQERCNIGSMPQHDWYFFSHKDKSTPLELAWIGQQQRGSGKPQDETKPYTQIWRKQECERCLCSTKAECLMARKQIGLCMNIAWTTPNIPKPIHFIYHGKEGRKGRCDQWWVHGNSQWVQRHCPSTSVPPNWIGRGSNIQN